MMAERTERRSVSQGVYEQMLKNISNQVWRPGTKIPTEKNLMELFSVSRISVREAIKRLVSLGLLDTIQGSGTYVREYNPDMFIAPISPVIYGMQLTKKDILDIMNVRRIEIYIAEKAAENSTPESVDALRRIQDKLALNSKNTSVHVETDFQFHLQICKMTGNPYMLQICRIMYDALERAMLPISKIMGPEQALYFHSRLIDTIARHYASEARATMEEHLRTTIDAVQSIADDDPRFFRHDPTAAPAQTSGEGACIPN